MALTVILTKNLCACGKYLDLFVLTTENRVKNSTRGRLAWREESFPKPPPQCFSVLSSQSSPWFPPFYSYFTVFYKVQAIE